LPGYGPEAGEALATHPKIGKISFTGSTLIGRKMLEYSAKSNLKKVGLELGGKSPVIVCPDADIAKAANLAWSCIMYNMG
jgi:acyl-CoA reductase-like NAD-dependent aldehyde dehydrogenase